MHVIIFIVVRNVNDVKSMYIKYISVVCVVCVSKQDFVSSVVYRCKFDVDSLYKLHKHPIQICILCLG